MRPGWEVSGAQGLGATVNFQPGKHYDAQSVLQESWCWSPVGQTAEGTSWKAGKGDEGTCISGGVVGCPEVHEEPFSTEVEMEWLG